LSEITQGRGQGGSDHQVTDKMADGLPKPFSELLTIWITLAEEHKMYFFVVCVFISYFPPVLYRKRMQSREICS